MLEGAYDEKVEFVECAINQQVEFVEVLTSRSYLFIFLLFHFVLIVLHHITNTVSREMLLCASGIILFDLLLITFIRSLLKYTYILKM